MAFLTVFASIAIGALFMSRYDHSIAPGNFWIKAASVGGLHPDVTDFQGFERIERRVTGNDALVCPAELCRNLQDIDPPAYPVPASKLYGDIVAIALAEPRTVQLKSESATSTGSYKTELQQVSALFRFPDLIAVEIIPRGPNFSTIALWSRSVVGRKDFGVNRARVERWLKRLPVGN